MKKALSLLLVLALCVSLSACCCNVPGFVEQFIPGEGALKNDNGFLDSGALGNGGLFGGDEDQQPDGSNTATLPVETQKIKYMPGCTNRNVDTVGPELVSLGLKVDIEYVYDNTVGEGYIISQSIHEGAEITQGQVVTLTVSKGPDVCPYEYSQKLLITAPYGSSYGTATLYEWGSGDWQMITSYSVTLGRNGIGTGSEGSKRTPQGIHKLGVVLTANSVRTNMDTYKVTSNTGVVDDKTSIYYNQIMEAGQVPYGTSFDRIGRGLTNGTTYATIFIEHNGNGFSSSGVVAGRGSAIGIRGQYGSLSPTIGDVDISYSDMIDLLSRLDSSKNPVAEIVAY